MTYLNLIDSLLAERVYLGSAFNAGLLTPARGRVLAALALTQRPHSGHLRVLEVGSWLGSSALLWAGLIRRRFEGGSVTCVDVWDSEAPDAQSLNVFKGDGRVQKLFWHNITAGGFQDLVMPLLGRSAEVLPRLAAAGNRYDLIFIDGSHVYEDVVSDIALSRQLLAERGVLCGDDLELTVAEVDPGNHAALLARRTDSARDPKAGTAYHPGVTQAVHDALGRYGRAEGIWYWADDPSMTMDLSPCPNHEYRETYPWSTHQDRPRIYTSKYYDVYRYKSGVVGMFRPHRENLWKIVDLLDHDIVPMLFFSPDDATTRSKVQIYSEIVDKNINIFRQITKTTIR